MCPGMELLVVKTEHRARRSLEASLYRAQHQAEWCTGVERVLEEVTESVNQAGTIRVGIGIYLDEFKG